MLFFDKKGVELLHLMSEQEKGIPIMKAFEFNAQNYKYGKEVYFDLIKKQIDDAFEITRHYVSNNVKGGGFDEYLALLAQDPESKAEIKALNELLEYLQNYTIEKEQAPEPQTLINSIFTSLQWSTIYYYVEPDLYGGILYKKDKLEKFIKDFNVSNSSNSLSNDHTEMARVINGDNNNKLKQNHINAIIAILPFLEKQYNEAFKNAKDDLDRLSNELERK